MSQCKHQFHYLQGYCTKCNERIFTANIDPLLPALMKDMTQQQLDKHISRQLRFIRHSETPDTIGSMLVIFTDSRITQFASTLDPATPNIPQALRNLADRIERREYVPNVERKAARE